MVKHGGGIEGRNDWSEGAKKQLDGGFLVLFIFKDCIEKSSKDGGS